MKQCVNVVVDDSCKDASDSHNGPKCVEIISQVKWATCIELRGGA